VDTTTGARPGLLREKDGMNGKVGSYRAVVLFAAAALMLGACGPKKVSLAISMSDFKFEPAAWEVPAGAEVTVTLTHSGSVLHEWVLLNQGYIVTPPFSDEKDGANVLEDHDVEAGQTNTFTFTAPTAAGSYSVICGVPAHIESGMVGTFVVK
jgi:plastocyanin